MKNGALVLYSGGLDSTTVLAKARVLGHEPLEAMSFWYGQEHDVGMHHAAAVFERLGVRMHHVHDLGGIGNQTSSLVAQDIEVPKGQDPRAEGIPSTYVPGRNLIFLSHAVSVAQERGLPNIFIGANAIDWSGYPDCRASFLGSFEASARLGTAWDVLRIHAPFVETTKADIIRWGLAHGVDYGLTFSCYDPQETHVQANPEQGYTQTLACGTCDACQLRLEAFREVEGADPIHYLPNINLLG